MPRPPPVTLSLPNNQESGLEGTDLFSFTSCGQELCLEPS